MVKVCPEWSKENKDGFSNFKTWARKFGDIGEMFLTSIDDYKDYSPDNMRFITLDTENLEDLFFRVVTVECKNYTKLLRKERELKIKLSDTNKQIKDLMEKLIISIEPSNMFDFLDDSESESNDDVKLAELLRKMKEIKSTLKTFKDFLIDEQEKYFRSSDFSFYYSGNPEELMSGLKAKEKADWLKELETKEKQSEKERKRKDGKN